MREIFDREHDDELVPQKTYFAAPESRYGGTEDIRHCSHCGEDIPDGSAVCPECGRWWTNSAS